MVEVGKTSATKLTTYFGCSLAYFIKYVMHEKVPQNFRLVFGKSIHYMLEKFYEVNFKSAESFGKFWKRYWFSAVAGDFLKGREKERLHVQEIIPNLKKPEFVIKIGNHVNMGSEPVGTFFNCMRLG
jgi:hypothetical protein